MLKIIIDLSSSSIFVFLRRFRYIDANKITLGKGCGMINIRMVLKMKDIMTNSILFLQYFDKTNVENLSAAWEFTIPCDNKNDEITKIKFSDNGKKNISTNGVSPNIININIRKIDAISLYTIPVAHQIIVNNKLPNTMLWLNDKPIGLNKTIVTGSIIVINNLINLLFK